MIEGVRRIGIERRSDGRGWLSEIFRVDRLRGIRADQVNVMESFTGALRGVHVHRDHTDVHFVASGRAVVGLRDFRRSSPTFGRTWLFPHEGSEITVIPPGVFHGMLFLEPSVLVSVESLLYDPEEEMKIRWPSPGLGIGWPDMKIVPPKMSETAPPFEEFVRAIEPWQELWKP